MKTYTGHGINQLFHTAPNIPHYAKNKAVGSMKPGMVQSCLCVSSSSPVLMAALAFLVLHDRAREWSLLGYQRCFVLTQYPADGKPRTKLERSSLARLLDRNYCGWQTECAV